MTIGTASSAMISGCRTICSPWNPTSLPGQTPQRRFTGLSPAARISARASPKRCVKLAAV